MPIEMNDSERELHISSLGRLLIKAMNEGDRAAAQQWLKLQNEAIAMRSPAQVARMEACYFSDQGDKALVEHQQRTVG